MTFARFGRADMYKKLLALRKSNPALGANASFAKLTTGMEDKIYAFARQSDKNKVVVLLNLTNAPVNFSVQDGLLTGEATEIFTNKKEKMEPGKSFSLPAWGYEVYSY
jgi:glycosidase